MIMGRGGTLMRRRRGLGQVSCPPGETVNADGFCAAPGASPYAAPWYCSLPIAELMPGCINANDMANLGPAASPQTVATLQAQWTQTDAQQCAAHPDQCAALKQIQSNPLSLLNPIPDPTTWSWQTWALIVGGGALVLMLLARR